jgi:hypothetical protein
VYTWLTFADLPDELAERKEISESLWEENKVKVKRQKIF